MRGGGAGGGGSWGGRRGGMLAAGYWSWKRPTKRCRASSNTSTMCWPSLRGNAPHHPSPHPGTHPHGVLAASQGWSNQTPKSPRTLLHGSALAGRLAGVLAPKPSTTNNQPNTLGGQHLHEHARPLTRTVPAFSLTTEPCLPFSSPDFLLSGGGRAADAYKAVVASLRSEGDDASASVAGGGASKLAKGRRGEVARAREVAGYKPPRPQSAPPGHHPGMVQAAVGGSGVPSTRASEAGTPLQSAAVVVGGGMGKSLLGGKPPQGGGARPASALSKSTRQWS